MMNKQKTIMQKQKVDQALEKGMRGHNSESLKLPLISLKERSLSVNSSCNTAYDSAASTMTNLSPKSCGKLNTISQPSNLDNWFSGVTNLNGDSVATY